MSVKLPSTRHCLKTSLVMSCSVLTIVSALATAAWAACDTSTKTCTGSDTVNITSANYFTGTWNISGDGTFNFNTSNSVGGHYDIYWRGSNTLNLNSFRSISRGLHTILGDSTINATVAGAFSGDGNDIGQAQVNLQGTSVLNVTAANALSAVYFFASGDSTVNLYTPLAVARLSSETGYGLTFGAGGRAIVNAYATNSINANMIFQNGGTLKAFASNVMSTNSGYSFYTHYTGNRAGSVVMNGYDQQVAWLSFYGENSGVVEIVNNSNTAATLTVGNVANATGLYVYAGDIKDSATGATTTGKLSFVKSGGSTLYLTGNNTYTGITTVDGGVLQLGDWGRTSQNQVVGTGYTGNLISGGLVINAGGTFKFGRTGSLTFGTAISGTGTLEVLNGTVTIDQNNSFSGLTRISGGTLNLGNGGTTGLLGGGNVEIAQSGQLRMNRSNDFTLNNRLSGTGTFQKNGTNMVALSADSSAYAGVVEINAGTLSVGAGGQSGAIGGRSIVIASGASLRFNREGDVELSSTISGAGSFVKDGSDSVIVTGTSGSYTGAVQLNSGQLQLGNGGAVGSLGTGLISIASGAELSYNHGEQFTAANQFSGVGQLIKNGQNTLIIVSTNDTYSGDIQVNSGTLQVGNGTTSGQLGSGIFTVSSNGGLDLRPASTDNFTFRNKVLGAGAVTFSNGTTTLATDLHHTGGTIIRNASTVSVTGTQNLGSGTIFLDSGTLTFGAGRTVSNSIGIGTGGNTLSVEGTTRLTNVLFGTGALTKDGSGTLVLEAQNTASGKLTVTSGGLTVSSKHGGAVDMLTGTVLGGSGSIAGFTQIASGATLEGRSGTTLSFGNGLSLGAHSLITAALAGPSSTELFSVTGDLTLDGTLEVSNAGGYGAGINRIFTYSGTLTDNGLELTAAAGSGISSDTLYLQTRIPGQINLVNNAGLILRFWDGGNAELHDNGSVDGGTGVWAVGNRNFTDGDGLANGQNRPAPIFAVFDGTAGTVTIDGATQAVGLQFAQTGYQLQGDGLTLTGGEIRVGTGAANDSSLHADVSVAISGTNGLRKSGEGTLTLTGENTYTGGTVVEAGTLIGDASSIRGNLQNDGLVVFNHATAASFAGTISGATSGQMEKRGAGQLTLTGSSSLNWAINAGELRTQGAFSGNAALANGTQLSFAQAGTHTYSGVLSGSGRVDLITGSHGFSGNSAAFAGSTHIGSGASLSVSGSLGGTVEVNGTLSGSGSIGHSSAKLTVSADGRHEVDGALGHQQNILGDYQNRGTLMFGMTPNMSGLLDVAGSVDIAGAVLSFNQAPTDPTKWDAITTPVVVLKAGGTAAINGTFASATSNLVFFDVELDYTAGDGNDLSASFIRNDLQFSDLADTKNQFNTGVAVTELGNENEIWRTMAMVRSNDEGQELLDALSGEVHEGSMSALAGSAMSFNRLARQRSHNAGNATPRVMNFLAGGAQTVTFETEPRVWIEGYGSRQKIDPKGGAAGMSYNSTGLMLGANAALETWTLGMVAGYNSGSIEASRLNSKSDTDSSQISLFAQRELGNYDFSVDLTFSHHNLDTRRQVLADTLTASYGATSLLANVELERGFTLSGANLDGYLRLSHLQYDRDGFSETGGAAALKVEGAKVNATFATVGVRYSKELRFGGHSGSLNAATGWQHVFNQDTPSSMHSFAGGQSFLIEGAQILQDSLMLELDTTIAITEKGVLGIGYSGQFSSNAQDQNLRTFIEFKF